MSSAKNFSLKDAEEKMVIANLRDGETAGVLAKELLISEMKRRESEKKKTAASEPSTETSPQ